MVKPESALRRLMRDTGKLLEPYGFEGGDPTWVRVTPDGVAAVARTRTFRSFTGGQQVLRFGLGSWATPTAWWEFCNWRNERLGLSPTALEAASGPGLLTDDGLPDERAELWSVRLDPYLPGHVMTADVTAIRAELPRRVHALARRALRMAEPGRYLGELLAQPNPHTGAWEAIAVLLAQHGPSAQFDEAIDNLRRCADEQPSIYTRHVLDYVSARTLSRRSA
ncbi:hypothetical protein GPX89_28230 [Nocardia sp. ET3-3]|uniref:DUF4304 domain-containing protein n=1 Tax=Nocardia terrae TaxID=2675851 RepID=A0A7K1V3Q0_9NOCA|nr:hypothetical protein [Nocardia terrae]MVU81122.1 hypothetical protein [Nocardia terrae]